MNNIDRIKSQGKQRNINIALKLLTKRYPDLQLELDDFDITVMANGKEAFVKLNRKFQFVPLAIQREDPFGATHNYEHDLSINLVTEEILPLDIWDLKIFYVANAQEREKIAFIAKHVSLPQGFEHRVVESADHYTIHSSNNSCFSISEVNKKTGELLHDSIVNGHIEPDPFKSVNYDPFEEITEDHYLSEVPLKIARGLHGRVK